MKRELVMKELQLLDAARRKVLHSDEVQKENEIKRLDEDINRIVSQKFLPYVENIPYIDDNHY